MAFLLQEPIILIPVRFNFQLDFSKGGFKYMIFKPKVKQNASKFLARFPLFLFLALVCLVGHPARAEAKTVLKPDMPNFVTIGEYDIIMTSGENLNKMFDIKANNKSELNDDRQYIAYYKIDKQKTSKISWSTYYNYWHSEKWLKDYFRHVAL